MEPKVTFHNMLLPPPFHTFKNKALKTFSFVTVFILIWIIALPNPAFSCGSMCYDKPENPLGMIHFWHHLGNNYYEYDSYQFDCDGKMYQFCEGSPQLGGAADLTPQDLSYTCFCQQGQGGTNPDGDKEWGETLSPGGNSCAGLFLAGGRGGLNYGSEACSSPPDRVGKPINLMTGNMYHVENDILLPSSITGGELAFVRTYNSRAAYLGKNGILGYGWSHTYDIGLETISPDTNPTPTFYRVRIKMADGRVVYFLRMPDGSYQGMYGEMSKLVKNPDGSFTYTLQNGTKYFFSPLIGTISRITRIEDLYGNAMVLVYNVEGKLDKVLDPLGRHLTITYNPQGKIGTVTTPAGGVFTYSYDEVGNLISLTNPAGLATTYLYQSPVNNHLLTGIRNANTQLVAMWNYDSQGKAIESSVDGTNDKVSLSYVDGTHTALTNSRMYQTTYKYNTLKGMHIVQEIIGPGCASCGGTDIITYSYDYHGFGVIKTTDLNGTNTIYEYDSRRPLITKRIDASLTAIQRETTYTYHPDYNFLLSETAKSVIDPNQLRRTTYDYDNDDNTLPNESPGLLLRRKIVEGLTRDSSGLPVSFRYVTSYTYDTLGRIMQVDGPRTDVTDTVNFTYYPVISGDYNSGMLKNINRTNGTTTLTEIYSNYDSNGNMGLITDFNGQATTYTYNALNRVTGITHQADGSTTGYTYDANWNLDIVTLPEGNHIDYTFDAANRFTQVMDDLGNSIKYTYDTEGNRVREERKDPAGAIKTFLDMEYYEQNRLKKITNPDTTYTGYGYDPNGNLTSVADPNGNVTSYEYDKLNRQNLMIQPGPINTVMTYDNQDYLTSVTDGNGNVTTYEYDDAGQLVKWISPDTGTTTYTYDGAGNTLLKKDANAIITTYTYDALNRLTHIHFPDSLQDITYTYDDPSFNGKGRLTGMSDPSGTTTYRYTSKGELYKEVKTFTGLSGLSYTTTYDYDGNGNLMQITYPSGSKVIYAYDVADRLTMVTGQNGPMSDTLAAIGDYLPYGPYQALTLGNGVPTTVAYNNRYQFDAQTVTRGAQTYLNYDYAHDANGNITSIANLLDPSWNLTYGYDTLDRLESALRTGPPAGSIGYSYDFTGNRKTETGSLGNSTYSYTNNLLMGITGAKNKSFTYDASGNTKTEDNRAYIYDPNNSLIQVTDGSITVGSYVYDGQGRRAQKVANGQTVYYLYDQYDHLIAEINQSGQLKTGYVHLPDRPLIKVDVNGGAIKVYYYHTDHHGTPLFMTDSTGQKVWSAILLPFGESFNVNEDVDGNGIPVVNNLRFPGQYYDAETGLHYNMMRDYNPLTGRYIESDPIGLAGGINTFAYTGNNPVNWVDPWGLSQAIFDPNTGTITIVDNNSNILGQFPAGNNTDSRSEGPIPAGIYPVGEPIPNTGSRSDRLPSQGHYFIPIYGIPGRSEIGIHGGRSGPQYPTMGCIRTGNHDVTNIVDIYRRDPITGIIVQPRR